VTGVDAPFPHAINTIIEKARCPNSSAASFWDIGILQSHKQIQLKQSIREMNDLSELRADLLSIEPPHDRTRELPFHHRLMVAGLPYTRASHEITTFV